MRLSALLWVVLSSQVLAAKPPKAPKTSPKTAPKAAAPTTTGTSTESSRSAPTAPKASSAELKLPSPALLAKTQELYASLEYDQVIPLSTALLARDNLTIDQRLEAYRLQGCAKAIVEDPVDAEKPFRLLLRVRPDYDLPKDTTPKILSVFRKVQTEEQALANQLREVDRSRIIANMRLVGEPPLEFKGGRPLNLSYRLKDPTGAVEAIRLPYRRQGQKVFSSLALERTEAGDWRGAIPGEFTADERGFILEYYVETADDEGPLLSIGTALLPKTLPITAGALFTERPKPVPRGVFIASAATTGVLGLLGGGLAIWFNISQANYRTMAQGQVDGSKLVAAARQGDNLATATNVVLISGGAALLTTIVLSTLTNFSPDP